MRKNLFKLSGISAIISAIIFGFNYYFFHFFTDEGFTLVFHEEASKPFVSYLIGQFGLYFLFLCLGALLVALICFPEKKKKANKKRK